MEITKENTRPETEGEEERYVPRPAWQVWGARIAAALFAVLVILQIVNIARGGR